MTAGRPIGNHIRNICAKLEEIGPAGTRELRTHFPKIEATNMSKYCSRAVGLGLMTVKLGNSKSNDFSVFSVMPDWRDLVDKRKTTKLKPPKPRPVAQSKWQGVNSIFSMGNFA